jgi:phosphoribosylanthranilate isomerase
MGLLTITGVDARTTATWIKAMGQKYLMRSGCSGVEFAILRSPKVGQSPRYPTRGDIQKIVSYVYPDQLAFHLCGEYARMAHDPARWQELADVVDFTLVKRVQVNSTEASAEAALTLMRFSAHIGMPVVMQWRAGPFPYLPKLDLLQDRSGGKGVIETEWFLPGRLALKARSRIGYAGGLSPENIAEQLPRITAASRGLYTWVDCESGVRTDDWLDIDKAEAMMAAVIGARP